MKSPGSWKTFKVVFKVVFLKKKRKYLSCHVIGRGKKILNTKDSFMEVCLATG